jgi:hypothetical protein
VAVVVARGMPAQGREFVTRGLQAVGPAMRFSGNAVLRSMRSSLVYVIVIVLMFKIRL